MQSTRALCAFVVFAFATWTFSQTPTLFSSRPAVNLTEAGGAIYFNGSCAVGGTTVNRISRRVPGGFDSTVYQVGCGTFNVRTRVAVDEEGWLYWLIANGELRAHISGSSNSSENRGMVADPSRFALNAQLPTAVSERLFFWAEEDNPDEFTTDGFILATPKNGTGTPETVFNGNGVGGIKWMHALSNTRLLALTGDGRLYRFSFTSLTNPFPVSFWSSIVIETDVQAANTGDGRLWYAVKNDTANRVEIRSVDFSDLGSGSSTEHARLGSTAQITGIDGDEDNVFFYSKPQSASQGALYRKARGSSVTVAPEQIAATPRGMDLHVVGRQVIWWELNGRTLTLNADAVALTRNLRFARPMEPVQVVQNPAQNVPMIRGKETFVRVYPELASTSVPGETSVNFWPNVVLLGADSDGNPLPGSPLNPMFSWPDYEFVLNPRRENMQEVAMFRLPIEWSEEPSVQLQAQVNPSQIIQESTFADNIQNRNVTFRHESPIQLVIHPLSTTDGKIGDFYVGEKYFPRFQPMLDRAEMLMPTDTLTHLWPGAIVIEEYEFPASFGPYEFSEGESDSWKVLAKLQFRQLPFKPVNLVSPLQVRSAALFIGDHPERAFNGVAIWDTLINKTSNIVRNPVARGATTVNSGISGVTLGHEIGHTYLRLHVDCPAGAPDLTTPFYPYNDCNIDDSINGNIGWDPISLRQIDFDDAGDLMSYAHQQSRPRWPSDFTYRGMAVFNDDLPFRPGSNGEKDGAKKDEAQPPSGDKGGVAGAGKEWMIFGGWTDGTPELLFVQPVAGDDLIAATDFYNNAEGDRTTYRIRGLNAGGSVVASAPVVAAIGADCCAGGEPLSFSALMPENNSIVRLELVATAAPNAPLASIQSGPAVPTVSVNPAVVGTAPAGTLDLSWSGSDADGEPLLYTVQLSRDGLTGWRTLIELTLATSAKVNLETLAGASSSCRFRVIASDGIHCSISTSGAFTLPDAQPEIYTFYDAGRGRKCDHLGPIVAEAGATIVVSATALDPEDGMLVDGDIAWQLTGPVNRNGTGTRWNMLDLPPGTYSLRCTATTSSGQTAVDTRPLEVLPKEVPDAGLTPELDGWPDEAAWSADRRPVSFTYGSGERATVRMIHRNGNLYVGVSGLPKGSNPRQFFGLTFHPDSGGGTTTTAADQRFSFYLDGEITRSVGNGGGYTNQDTLNGFQARIAGNDDFWAIEACIPDAALGGWNNQIVRIGVGHYHRNVSGDDTFWPANGFWNRPGTWGLVRFGEPNPPPLDDDGDGLLDSWERSIWGSLNRDGLGDDDLDGQSDAEEFLAGTNPRVAASALQFTDASVVAGPGGGVTIQWDSAAGPTYDLYASPHPEGPYSLVQSSINATPPMNNYNLTPPLANLRFFRIATTPID